ncbi:MAG: PTS sugar transporter subunit IIA [Desulfomicrobium escambiense]|nr:PTS sugar transporter subunit IIA [Desulfomicrobium escambiense]
MHRRGEGRGRSASVLRSVVAAVPLPADVNRELLLQMLLARESVGSTGIGDGVAIPHARNPIVMHLPRPLVCLCFLEQPDRVRRDRRQARAHPLHAS